MAGPCGSDAVGANKGFLKIHPMKIELRLHGDFRKYIGGSHDTLDLEIPDGTTINDVLEQLGVEDRDFWMSAVNREVAERTAVLHDGDRVEFFGPVAGGAFFHQQT